MYSSELNTSITDKTNLRMSNIMTSEKQYNWKSAATYHSQLIHCNQSMNQQDLIVRKFTDASSTTTFHHLSTTMDCFPLRFNAKHILIINNY